MVSAPGISDLSAAGEGAGLRTGFSGRTTIADPRFSGDTCCPADAELWSAVTLFVWAAPNNAFPANTEAHRHNILPAMPALRAPQCSFETPNNRATRSASGLRFAAMASAGALCHSAIAASARAYSTAFPHTAMATSSQHFSRSARILLLSHHTAG